MELREEQFREDAPEEQAHEETLTPNGQDQPDPPQQRIRLQFDIEYNGSQGENFEGESLTVPDMNLSVKQLLENHTRMHDGSVKHHTPMYFETEVPVFTDFTDVEKYREQLQERLNQTNEFIKRELQEAEENNEKIEEGPLEVEPSVQKQDTDTLPE